MDYKQVTVIGFAGDESIMDVRNLDRQNPDHDATIDLTYMDDDCASIIRAVKSMLESGAERVEVIYSASHRITTLNKKAYLSRLESQVVEGMKKVLNID